MADEDEASRQILKTMAKLMKWMGHSSVEMPMKYYSLAEDESRQAMLAVPFDGMEKRPAS